MKYTILPRIGKYRILNSKGNYFIVKSIDRHTNRIAYRCPSWTEDYWGDIKNEGWENYDLQYIGFKTYYELVT